MKSLLPAIHSKEIIHSPPFSALWSKVNVPQMPVHNQQLLRVVFKELKLNRVLIAILFGKMIVYIQYFSRISSNILNIQTHVLFWKLPEPAMKTLCHHLRICSLIY